MTALDTAAIRAAAEAATPGTWRWLPNKVVLCVDNNESTDVILACQIGIEGDVTPSDADAAYIVATQPSVVLALLAEVEALRAERDAAREWAAIVVQRVLETPLPPEGIRPEFTVGSVVGAWSLARGGSEAGGGE